MKTNLILTGIGGGVGSMMRYVTFMYVSRHINSNSFAYGTFVANVIGCAVIGILYGLSERYEWLTPSLRLLMITGFCGGYTTFSAFAYENMQLLQHAHYGAFALYTVVSFSVCIAAVFAGVMLIRVI